MNIRVLFLSIIVIIIFIDLNGFAFEFVQLNDRSLNLPFQNQRYSQDFGVESYDNVLQNSMQDYPKIDIMERNLYKKTFVGENIYKRLSRLENSLFKRTFQNLDLYSRVENLSKRIDTKDFLSNVEKSKLDLIERQTLNKVFSNDGIDSRLSRIEQSLFGAIQSDDLSTRYNRIMQYVSSERNRNIILPNFALQNNMYNQPYNMYNRGLLGQNGYLPPSSLSCPYMLNQAGSKSSRMKKFFNNLLDNLVSPAQITGFTPPVYAPNYFDDNNQFGYSSGQVGTGGYNFLNKNYATGSSVKILY